jgi:pSer/pThr/pTyr-binding forkhead associated (FHA) protein
MTALVAWKDYVNGSRTGFMATLCEILEDGSIAGRWELGGQPLVIGRGDEAQAQLDDGSASRRHAIILRESEHYVIEDLGSQNGTWVAGRRVLAARLNHDDRIQIGRTQLIFLERQHSVTTVPKTPASSPQAESPRPTLPALPAIKQEQGLASRR